ncbi:UNVERIFIED_CONTAM: protein root UVB sensitive 5 [Sesamum radiatum]|uniref:Protein root UVB sensitive 5 n=1 Tax=Sesamum radiatum TaxID=300843 RepID=A0AAW2KTS7_SESRA
MVYALRFSCHSFGLDSRRNSIPAPVHRFQIRCKSSLPHSAGAQDSQSLEDDGDAHLILLEKYGNGTSKRYVVEGDSQIRTILEEPLPGTKVLQDSYSMGTDKALTWLPKVIKDFVLPAGFPDSVSDDYLEYILLQFPTNVTGWICHTLVTSSLLQAVGVGSLSGTAAAASAAAIRWVSKDGIGAVGRLFIGGRFGNLFDDDPKQWRLYADFIGSTGSIFDLSTQLYPAYFLPLASLGNLAKAVGRGLRDPSFRVIQNHFAISGNLGEVSAKEEVWEVAAELVGLALGILALINLKRARILVNSHIYTGKFQVRMLLELYAEEKYFLVVNQVQTEFEVFVSFKEGATSISVLRSVWQSYWLHQNWSSSDDIFSQLDRSLIELKDRGYLRAFLRCHSKTVPSSKSKSSVNGSGASPAPPLFHLLAPTGAAPPLGLLLHSHIPRSFFFSANKPATALGPPEKDAILNGTPPAHYAGEDSIAVPEGMRRELMPRHVAIIMDGNRRWARMRGYPLVETDFLMGLFERGLRDELQHLMSAGVRISIIGDVSKLLKPLQVLLADAMETTINNSKLHLIIAVNYSGQNDIVQACQKLAVKVKDGLIEPEEINEFLVERELETNCTDFPYPDLLIRTSGEIRISNFLLWQLAYTELYFAHSLWPDFGEDEFREAVCSFQIRQRRYGGQKS